MKIKKEPPSYYDLKRTSPAGRIFHLQPDPLDLCQLCGNGQPQPKMFFPVSGLIPSIKTVKNQFLFPIRNSRPVINDVYHDVGTQAFRA